MKPKSAIKERGAQRNFHNHVFELCHEMCDDFLEFCHNEVYFIQENL
jgi:hypothetical protein